MSKNTYSLRLPNLAATDALGCAIADAVSEKAIICLSGNLGAGKTHLVKATGKALGIPEVISSPTFSVCNEYESGRLPFYHFDFYRLSESLMATGSPVDTLAIEVDEIMSLKKMVSMIEWPEAFLINQKNYFDDLDRITIRLQTLDNEERLAEIQSCGELSDLVFKSLLNTLCK